MFLVQKQQKKDVLTLCGMYVRQCDDTPTEGVKFPQVACHGARHGSVSGRFLWVAAERGLKESKAAALKDAHRGSCHL